VSRYQVIEPLGQGGMGVVYRALQTDLRREVALKVLHAWCADDPEIVARFVREARTCSQLSHPGIVRVLDFGDLGDGHLFYAMEMLGARDLERTLEAGGPLPVDRAVDLLEKAADALAYLHDRGIIHRDVKPANMMVDPENRLVLTDFGLVKVWDRTSITRQGTRLGTPRFMAPELFARPDLTETPAVDAYALGASFWELISGARPYPRVEMRELIDSILTVVPPALAAVRTDVPEWLSRLLAQCLDKDQGARPTAVQVREACREHRAPASRAAVSATAPTVAPGPPPPTVAPGPPLPPAPPPARHQVAISTTGPLVALVAAAALGAASLAWQRPAENELEAAGAGPGPAPAPATAHDLDQRGRTLVNAVRRFDPRRQIERLHADLIRTDQRQWFRTSLVPDMEALRRRWKVLLGQLLKSADLPAALRDVSGVRRRFFEEPGVDAEGRLAVYLALHDLLDLQLYCRAFDVPLGVEAQAALWDGYGQQTRSSLPVPGGAVCMEFARIVEHRTGPWTRIPPPRPGWTVLPLAASERFHSRSDVPGDLITWSETMAKVYLEYRHAEALPIPSLDRIDRIELSAVACDLYENNRFVVSLSTDGRRFVDVAVLRGRIRRQPVELFHPVERAVLRGSRLYVKVRLVVLPDMSINTEKGHLPRLVVAYGT
jgi:serine/threonine-protein kinase